MVRYIRVFVSTCFRSAQTAHIQDAMVHALKGQAEVALAARSVGIIDQSADRDALRALFATLTNVNFDAERCAEMLRNSIAQREALKKKVRCIS